jgi:hypothetical protein
MMTKNRLSPTDEQLLTDADYVLARARLSAGEALAALACDRREKLTEYDDAPESFRASLTSAIALFHEQRIEEGLRAIFLKIAIDTHMNQVARFMLLAIGAYMDPPAEPATRALFRALALEPHSNQRDELRVLAADLELQPDAREIIAMWVGALATPDGMAAVATQNLEACGWRLPSAGYAEVLDAIRGVALAQYLQEDAVLVQSWALRLEAAMQSTRESRTAGLGL